MEIKIKPKSLLLNFHIGSFRGVTMSNTELITSYTHLTARIHDGQCCNEALLYLAGKLYLCLPQIQKGDRLEVLRYVAGKITTLDVPSLFL